MMYHDDDFDPDHVSKSQRKRDMNDLQALGRKLTTLPATFLKKLPLPEDVLNAVLDAQRFKNEALRRQLQYLGKLMRHVEVEPLVTAIAMLEGTNASANAHFHQLERWRDRLIKEGNAALGEFIGRYPHTDSQHLHQLIHHAQQEANKTDAGAARKLFRYIRDIDESIEQE